MRLKVALRSLLRTAERHPVGALFTALAGLTASGLVASFFDNLVFAPITQPLAQWVSHFAGAIWGAIFSLARMALSLVLAVVTVSAAIASAAWMAWSIARKVPPHEPAAAFDADSALSQAQPQHRVSLQDLLDHLEKATAFRSVADDRMKWFEALDTAIHDALSLGELVAFGRPKREWFEEMVGEHSAMAEIRRAFWETGGRIKWYSIDITKPSDRYSATGKDGKGFYDVHFNAAQAHRLWPATNSRTSAQGEMPALGSAEYIFTGAAENAIEIVNGGLPYALTIGRSSASAMYVYRAQPFVKTLKVPAAVSAGTPLDILTLRPTERCHSLHVGQRMVLVSFDGQILQIALVRAWDTRNDDDANRVLFAYRFYEPGTSLIKAL